MSRHHEHLNFPAETLGADRSGFYREARVLRHAFVSFLTTTTSSRLSLPVPASIPEFSVVNPSSVSLLICITVLREDSCLRRKFLS